MVSETALHDTVQSNISSIETDEPSTSEPENKTDRECASIGHQLGKVNNEIEMTSSSEPQTKTRSVPNLSLPEPSSELNREETLCGEVKNDELQNPDAMGDKIMEPPSKKRVKRRMGMCGLGDRKRRPRSVGETSRQVSNGLTEEADTQYKDIENGSSMDGSTVIGFDTAPGEERRELDDVTTLVELLIDNILAENEEAIRETLQNNGPSELMDETTTVGDKTVTLDCTVEKSSSLSLLHTVEQMSTENISEQNDITTLMIDLGLDPSLEEPISNHVEENFNFVMMDDQSFDPALEELRELISENQGSLVVIDTQDLEDLEEHQDDSITDTTEKHQGSALMVDGKNTEDISKLEKSNTLEAYGGSVLMVDGRNMGEHRKNSPALIANEGHLRKPAKDRCLDEKNVDVDLTFYLVGEQISKPSILGPINDDKSLEELPENESSVLMDVEGTLDERDNTFKNVPLLEKKKASGLLTYDTTTQVDLNLGHSELADICEEIAHNKPSISNNHNVEAFAKEPERSGMVNNSQNNDLNADFDACEGFLSVTTERIKEPKVSPGVRVEADEVHWDVRQEHSEVIFAQEDPVCPLTQVAIELKLSEQAEQREPVTGQKRKAGDPAKGAESPEVLTTSRPEDENAAYHESNFTDEQSVNGAPPSDPGDDTHVSNSKPTLNWIIIL